MDGFNVISVEKDNLKSAPVTLDPVEIIDEEKEREKAQKEAKTSGWLLFVSVGILLSCVAYFVFLVVYRVMTVGEIIAYSEQMRAIGKNIDLNEMQEFQAMDATLKAINGRLSKHVITSDIINLVNQNIRKNLQVTEYRLDVKASEVETNFTAIAPSFKELAEQTEKFFQLKSAGLVKGFGVTNISFESDTKRIRFTMKILFDKSKVNATAI